MAQQLPTQSQFGDYSDWPGRAVLDSSGQRLGGVREIYLDRETGRPEWVLVDLDDADARFVPLTGAAVEAASIRVAHSADTIRQAPGIGTEPRIDQSEERRLYAHYGLETRSDGENSAPSWQARGGEPTPPTETPSAERSASAFLTDDPPSHDAPAPFAAATRDADAPPRTADEPAHFAGPPRDADATRDDDEPAHLAGPATRNDAARPRGTDVPAPFGGGTWSDAAATGVDPTIEAPPPAEPPSPAEIEAAHIPQEPPAASDRATEYETAPFGAVAPPPADGLAAAPTATSGADESAAASLTDDTPPPTDTPGADESAAAFLTDDTPPPTDTPGADESAAAFLTDDTTPPPTAAPTDTTRTDDAPPPTDTPGADKSAAAFLTDDATPPPAAAPTDAPRTDDTPAVVVDAPPPDATLTPHAAPPTAPPEPSWTSATPPPLPQEPAQPGALEVVKRSPEKIALAALAAALLFLIVRKLR